LPIHNVDEAHARPAAELIDAMNRGHSGIGKS
jgi:hypothetical protein